VLADRDQWKAVLAKISINSPRLYEFLHLIHTNKKGSNDTAIQEIIDRNDEPERALRYRFYLSSFDKLSESRRSTILDQIRSQMSLSLYDTKTDVSTSYATTDFVPRILDQSKLYVSRKTAFKSLL
jgi:hypothetical protein